MESLFSREVLLLLGGFSALVGMTFIGSRIVRALDHGFSIRLQLFFAIWTTSMLATGVIGAWVIDRLQVRAAELALTENTAVGVVLEIIREFGPKIALLTALLGVGAAGAAYFFGRVVAEPIERLTRTAEAIARGERHQSLPRPSGREVRRLSAAFDSMRRALEDRHQIEEFVADLSHELKNPVSAIRAATEVLNEGAMEDEVARTRFVGRIDEASRRLELLLNDLLSLARLEARGVAQTKTSLSLDELIKQAAKGLSADIESRNLNIDLSLDSVRIQGDGPWVRRAFENLLANSIRYSPPGGRIRVSLSVRDGLAWIRVEDEGPGVDQKMHDTVFDRFVTDRREANQTGLGLAIVQSVAELHGGTARLLPDVNGGCFEFSVRAA